MADYWKSVPKRLCSICNVWMYDNRPSIERHERSSKHLEKLEKKMERAMRPKRNDEKIVKVVDQLDPLSHVTNSAFKIDGIGVAKNSSAPSISKKPKKFKINFSNKSEILKAGSEICYKTPNVTTHSKNIPQPEIVDSHPILGGWETVRIIERPASVEEYVKDENVESMPSDKDVENTEDPISEFQIRINAKSIENNSSVGGVEFKKGKRKRPSSQRKPIDS